MDNTSMAVNMTAAEGRANQIAEEFGFRSATLFAIYSAIAALALMGLLGNVVSMVVWTRPQLKSSSAVLLTALAACDFFILITVNIENYSAALEVNYRYSPAIVYMAKFIFPYFGVWCPPVLYTAQTASIYLTLTIAFERYIAVCRPFQARLVCTYSRACWYAAIVITISILYNLIAFLVREVVPVVDDNGDITSYGTGYTDLARSPLFHCIYEIYITWLRLILIYLLPFICIAVLNTLIYLEMRRAEKRRQTLTVSQRTENRLTLMLVYVVAEFLVCSSIQLFSTTVDVLELSEEKLGFKMVYFAPLAVFFETFNSSSNFLTYVLFGRGFREALLSTFSCCSGLRSLRRSSGTEEQELNLRTR